MLKSAKANQYNDNAMDCSGVNAMQDNDGTDKEEDTARQQ